MGAIIEDTSIVVSKSFRPSDIMTEPKGQPESGIVLTNTEQIGYK